MDIDSIKEKAYGLADDIREGLGIMDRYILKRDVRIRTVVTNTQNGTKLMDTENAYSKEYPVIKLVCAAAAATVGLIILVVKLRNSTGRKRIIKHQKSEIKRLRKLCKDSGIDIKKK